MNPTSFARARLRDVRLLVAFVSPPSWPRETLHVWPATWIRSDAGEWHPLDFGRSHRARQLLTLLAVHPEGLNGPAASRFFDVAPAPDVDGGVSASTRDERAKSALGTLRGKLADNGIADVSGLLEVAPGHRRSPPWRLRGVTTDVRVARDAAEADCWDLAWLLLHGGTGQLVGVPRTRPVGRRRIPPHLGLASRQREAMRTGVLPAALIEEAEAATRATLAHFGADAAAPPMAAPRIVEQMLRATGQDAPAPADEAALARRSAGVGGGGAVVATAAGELMPTEVTPLTVASQRRRWRAGIPTAAAVCAALVIASVLILVLPTERSRGGSLTSSSPTTATSGRLEVQTYVSDANSFSSPRMLDGRIVKIAAGSTVLVACRKYVPGPRSFAPYWWYRLDDPLPGRWVPANSFLNGDPASDYLGPHPHPPRHQHAVDTAVALCGPKAPDGTLATPTTTRVPTYSSAMTGAGPGPVIDGRRRVVVSCKVSSHAAASEPGGYAYRIASAPWSDRFYAPARAFRNAIPADTGPDELVDPEIPTCPG